MGREDGGGVRETHSFVVPLVTLILFPGKSGPRKRDTSVFFTVADIMERLIYEHCVSHDKLKSNWEYS